MKLRLGYRAACILFSTVSIWPHVYGEKVDGAHAVKLARELCNNGLDEKNYTQAEELMALALASGRNDSVVELALYCHAPDSQTGNKWLKLAAEHGNPYAQTMYANDLSITGPQDQVFLLYLSAAQKGEPSAEERVGWHFESGTGVPIDRRKAIDWYKKASAHGSTRATYRTAKCYEILGDTKLYELWLERAASLKSTSALVELADIRSRKVDDARAQYGAFRMYYQAALQNDKKAMAIAGSILMKGIPNFLPKNETLGAAFIFASYKYDDYKLVYQRFPDGSKDVSKIREFAEAISDLVIINDEAGDARYVENLSNEDVDKKYTDLSGSP